MKDGYNFVTTGSGKAPEASPSGDRIVAVGDANGRWVDARNVRLGDVVGLIRGEPNTQVSLQIQSPGDAAPRAVTLGRQQIIHSPQ